MNKNPFILGATYNTLFVEGTGDQDGLGLLPENILNLFSQANAEPTYQAIQSTHPNRWGKTADHFCCTQAQVGCGTSAPPVTASPCSGTAVTTQSCSSPTPEPTPAPISNSNIQTVRASVGGVTGQTGRWWCQNHFGNNLLSSTWDCIGSRCSQDAVRGEIFDCGRR